MRQFAGYSLLLVYLVAWGSRSVCSQAPVPSTGGARLPTSRYAGSDVGKQIAAANLAMGLACGVVVVDRPGIVTTAFTLSSCHSLEIDQALTWSAAASMLVGDQSVTCTAGAAISYHPRASGASMFTTPGTGVRNLEAGDGCTVEMPAGSALQEVSFLRVPRSASRVTVRRLVTTRVVALWACGESKEPATDCHDIDLLDSTVSGTHFGLYVFYTHGARAQGNRFLQVIDGAEFWGGDNTVAGAERGRMTDVDFSHNACQDVGACTWGSMGERVTMLSNTAHGCQDVCFDVEGSADVVLSKNVADHCGNGCGATFYAVRNVTMTGNEWANSGSIVLIKNVSQNPDAIHNLVIEKNKLTCVDGTCPALSYDAASFEFSDNGINNGYLVPTSYNGATIVTGNRFHFDKPIPAGAAAIRVQSVIHGQALTVAGNWIASDTTQPGDTACISLGWGDFNQDDTYTIRDNHCEGKLPFPVDLFTVTFGKNPGPRAHWIVGGNWWGSNTVRHDAGGGNETYQEVDRYIRRGGLWTHVAVKQ